MRNGVVEDGWIRGQAGNGKLVDIALQGAVVEHVAGDVVQPQALSQVMQLLGGFHVTILHVDAAYQTIRHSATCPVGAFAGN
jgi:hypothetical protein